MSATQLARLAPVVRARREELGLSVNELWFVDGQGRRRRISTNTWRGLSGASTTGTRPFATTLANLDQVLRWEVGSARRVAEGSGEPTPVHDAGPELRMALDGLVVSAAKLSAEDRRKLAVRVEKLAQEAEARRGK